MLHAKMHRFEKNAELGAIFYFLERIRLPRVKCPFYRTLGCLLAFELGDSSRANKAALYLLLFGLKHSLIFAYKNKSA
jgi:hypothetical protein